MRYVARYRCNKGSADIDRTLCRLVSAAYGTVRVYREAFDRAGVVPGEIRGAADLPRLPILKKEALARPASLADVLRRGVDPGHCVRVGTSGSTGLPLNVYMSRTEDQYRRLLLWRAWRRLAPLRLPMTVVDVGNWVEGDAPLAARRRGPITIVRVSIARPVEEQLAVVRRYRPQVISGYPTAVDLLAEAGGVSDRRLRLVACRGEILDAATRKTIEGAFSARVADFYNAEEVGNIAWECPADPTVLHVNTDGCIVEVVDDAGRQVPVGTEGRIVVSNLSNETMPFLRYDLADRGSFCAEGDEPCGCGSRAPRLRVVSGRDDDYVVLPDGRRVSPRLLAMAINRAFSGLSPCGSLYRHFRRFQVTQDRVDHVRIDIVPESGPVPDFGAILPAALAKLHPDLRCTIR
ncbi:MAG: AMP-binding protein, partial [Candidatus Bipolaricaulis sp.]|nr:AMP-binding protein [Candidatus Bipolaricaulis sp.]